MIDWINRLVNFNDLNDVYHLMMIVCGVAVMVFTAITCISNVKKNKSQSDFYKYKKKRK